METPPKTRESLYPSPELSGAQQQIPVDDILKAIERLDYKIVKLGKDQTKQGQDLVSLDIQVKLINQYIRSQCAPPPSEKLQHNVPMGLPVSMRAAADKRLAERAAERGAERGAAAGEMMVIGRRAGRGSDGGPGDGDVSAGGKKSKKSKKRKTKKTKTKRRR